MDFLAQDIVVDLKDILGTIKHVKNQHRVKQKPLEDVIIKALRTADIGNYSKNKKIKSA